MSERKFGRCVFCGFKGDGVNSCETTDKPHCGACCRHIDIVEQRCIAQ